MDLQTKHMKENNRTCMTIGVVIQVLMLIVAMLYGADRYILPTGAMVAGIIVCMLISAVGYLKLGQSELAHYPILLSLAISYMLTLLGAFHTPYMYAFGTLIGIACIVYNDKRICLIASVTAIVENLIFIVIFYLIGAGQGLSNKFMVPTNFVFIIVYAIISYIVTKDNNRQTDEVMGDIKKRSEEQLKSAEEVKETAEKISVKLEEANEAMASLSEKVHSSTEAVEQISSSVSMTAEAIQTQTEMNSNIMNSLNNITEESKEMQNLSEGVKTHVGDGNVIITELQKQAEETAVINYQTAQMTEELVKSAETVKDIVSAILAISSQTNLLALNASIEAARAGEAGRGFAVVAEEIRKLSEDTKSSAEMISNTIDGLITSVHSASDNMQKSVDSSNKQGEMIKETGVKFGEILESVNVLAKNVEEISANVEACAEATSTVMDSITDLSATSEEVAASSESSLTLSYECEKDMDATNSILADILRISRREAR